jgi:hypothetical protein
MSTTKNGKMQFSGIQEIRRPMFCDTEGNGLTSGIQRENVYLLGYRGKMINFGDAAGNYQLLGYSGKMIIF